MYVEKIIHNKYGNHFLIHSLTYMTNIKNQISPNPNFKYSFILMDKLWKILPQIVPFNIL